MSTIIQDPRIVARYLSVNPVIPNQQEAVKYLLNNLTGVWPNLSEEVKSEFTLIWRADSVPKEVLSEWRHDRVPATRPSSLTRKDYQEVAAKIKLYPATVRAFAEAESNGGGYNNDNSLKMLFEGQWFYYLANKAGVNVRHFAARYPSIVYPRWVKTHYLGGIREYERLSVAIQIQRESAIMASSWGMFQLLGVNYKEGGHASPQAMLNAYQTGERAQLESIANFMKVRGIADALIRGDWTRAVTLYNGPGQVAYYSQRLRSLFQKWYREWGTN